MPKAVISYIPALHQGYLKFFSKHPGKLFVIGSKFIKDAPRMDRDIRAVEPQQIAKMISSLSIMEGVQVLENISQIPDKSQIIMPEDDFNRAFAKQHLKGRKVSWIDVFLRWDGHSSAMAFEAPADRKISKAQFDKEMLGKAEDLAKKSPDWWRQIGAIVAIKGKPVITGYNRPLVGKDYTLGTFGDPRANFDYGQQIELVKTIHAEAGIIAEAAKQGIKLEGASMYVTTFPCPVCAKSMAAAGIKKVYYRQGYSLLDAEDVLKAHGVEIILVK